MPCCRSSGPNSRKVKSEKPEKTSGVPIGSISKDVGSGDSEAVITCRTKSLGISKLARATGLFGLLASVGTVLSKSLISSISSIGVMPQIASGENTLSRSATAPINLPSI